jgi:DNA-binding MarR family transcriptional regulator
MKLMSLKVDPDSLGFLITDMARMMRLAMERRIAEAGLGLTAGEARALLQIAAHEGSRQNVIAEHMGIEPMTFCTYVDRLERVGLAERVADPGDRRAKLILTTAKADDMIVLIRQQTGAVLEEIQAGLSADERTMLLSIMKTMRASISTIVGNEVATPAPQATKA